jgi:hypothetical protein
LRPLTRSQTHPDEARPAAAARTVVRPASDVRPVRAHGTGTAIEVAGTATALADELQRRIARPAAAVDVTPLLDFAAAQADGGAERAARSLELRIRAHLERGSLEVRLTDNRYSMISVRRETGARFQVRLHHMFVDADPVVTRALARYIGHNDAESSRLLGEFIDRHQASVRPERRPPRVSIDTAGRYHDVQAIFDDLNRRYFGGAIEARITWGQRLGRPRRRNSIKMGSYSVEDKLIRMHRALDREFVPGFFVEWIVFHEMLHQIHDADVVNGRRHFHTRAFVDDEARFEHYGAARAWERAHLDALLTY